MSSAHSNHQKLVSCLFIRRGAIAWQRGSGRKTKIAEDIQGVVEQQMCHNDETTASQLNILLTSLGNSLDLPTILCCRMGPGWTFRGSAYCQLIRDVNKTKRLEFARVHRNDKFNDVIFTGEYSVQLEYHRKRCCRKQAMLLKARRTSKKQAKVSNTHK